MDSDRTRSFVELRGGTADTRPDAGEPYSAASYAAQYGITVDDAEALVEQYGTHGEVKERIFKEYVCDPNFRKEALELGEQKTCLLTDEERDQIEASVIKALGDGKRPNINASLSEIARRKEL